MELNQDFWELISYEDLPDLNGRKIYIDTETVGLYGKIRLVQIYCPELYDKCWVIVWKDYGVDKFKDAHWILFNGIYDFSCFDFIPDKWDDVFLAGRLKYYYLPSHSLESIMTEVLGRDEYALRGINKQAMHKYNWGKALGEEHITYAALDVFYLKDVWEDVESQTETISYKLDKRTIEGIFHWQKNGMPVKLKDLLLFEMKTKQEIADINLPINCNSYIQVRKYIGSDKSDDSGLLDLHYQGNTKASMVRDVRKKTKQLSFINKWKGERIYGHFNVATKSGRYNCSEDNLQQLPSSLKHLLGYSEEDNRVMIHADFAQLELRTICALLPERTMEDLFRKGEDLHIRTAQFMFNVAEPTDDQRQQAKIGNFFLLYGAGWKMYQQKVYEFTGKFISDAEAQKLRKAWLNFYSDIDAWHKKNMHRFRTKGWWTTALGRPYKAERITDFNNIQNSGTGAEVTKLSNLYLWERIKDDKDVKLLNVVHDSFTLETTIDKAEKYCDILGESMVEGWIELSKMLVVKDLPMPVKVCVGKTWGKEIEKSPIFKKEYLNDNQKVIQI